VDYVKNKIHLIITFEAQTIIKSLGEQFHLDCLIALSAQYFLVERTQNVMIVLCPYVFVATKNQVFQCLRGGIEVLSRLRQGFESPWGRHLKIQAFQVS